MTETPRITSLPARGQQDEPGPDLRVVLEQVNERIGRLINWDIEQDASGVRHALRLCRIHIEAALRESPLSRTETRDQDEPTYALRNIRLRAARGRTFGHQATPQTLERMVQAKDEALTDILRYCADAGEVGSILRRDTGDYEGDRAVEAARARADADLMSARPAASPDGGAPDE